MTPLAERLADETLALCRIPSPIGQEQSLCDHIEGVMRLKHLPVRREGNALILEGAPQGAWPGGRPLALVGHLDTVPDFPGDGSPRLEGQRVYGKGASDMKGGLAVSLALLSELPPERRPHLILYDREEGPYAANGLEPLFAKQLVPPVSLAVCLEPTSNALQLGCVGSLHATIRLRGRSAHSARPWEGENAIHKAGDLLAKLASTERRPVRHGDLTYYEVAQVTGAQGGRARNVVPDLLELNLNYRFAPGTSIAQAQLRVVELVGDAEIEFTDLSPSGPTCEGNPDLQRLRARGVPIEAKQAWTDVARFGVHGIDAVNFGPGNPAQAHQVDEWCEIPALAKAFELLQAWLLA
jgi:succinyl-diaminopimelate desuccinylase